VLFEYCGSPEKFEVRASGKQFSEGWQGFSLTRMAARAWRGGGRWSIAPMEVGPLVRQETRFRCVGLAR
jgi:hypothetical protein